MVTKSNISGIGTARRISVILLPVLMLAISIVNGFLAAELNAQAPKNKKVPDEEIVVTGFGRQKQDRRNLKNDTINYIVDGVSVKDISSINPDSIESVNVLKEDRTIIIRTKRFAGSKLKVQNPGPVSNGSGKILYILDDRVITEDVLKEISPETIESVSVIKNEAGISRYTNEDYDGVIVVKSKKK